MNQGWCFSYLAWGNLLTKLTKAPAVSCTVDKKSFLWWPCSLVPRVRLQNGNYKPALVSEVLRTRMEHSKCPTENIKSPKLVTVDWRRLKITLGLWTGRDRRERCLFIRNCEFFSFKHKHRNSSIKWHLRYLQGSTLAAPVLEKNSQIHQNFKCQKSGGLENTDSWTVKTNRSLCLCHLESRAPDREFNFSTSLFYLSHNWHHAFRMTVYQH